MSKKTRQERIEELTQTINDTLDNYIEDPNLMADFYKFRSQFHNYSLRNSILIKDQFSGSIQVASYNKWKEKGYQVQKGEKAIYIFAPNTSKIVTDLKGKELGYLNKANNNIKQQIKQGKLKVKDKITGFRPVPVFDIRQTDCPIEEYPKYFQQFYLVGEAEHYDELLSALDSYRDSVGITQIQGIIAHQQAQGADGYSIPDKDIIYVRKDLSELDYLNTYVHELAHSQLHKKSSLETHEKEYQAELTAGVVTGYFRLKTKEASTNYLHNWTKDKTLIQKENLVNEVMNLADQMIKHVEKHLEKKFNLTKDKQKMKFFNRDLDSDGTIDIHDHDPNDSKIQTEKDLDNLIKEKTSLNNRLNHYIEIDKKPKQKEKELSRQER